MHIFGWTQPPQYRVAHYVCSWECFDRWAWSVVQDYRLGPWGSSWFVASVRVHEEYVARLRAIDAENTRRIQLGHARNLTDAARHEDAARVYEGLGMWKEAGETRRTGLRQTVTQVHVNLNDLVDQLRRAGLSANYTCPVCKSPFKISGETPPDSLRSCQYCGSVIQPTDLIDTIAKVIGYR